jgi:hypothetical protein
VLSKALAWWLSGSVSLLAGLTDSALDAVASFLNLLAVHYALRPADDDHRFGHGKAEAWPAWRRRCSSGQCGADRGAGGRAPATPQPLGDTAIGIAVMLLSLVLTVACWRCSTRSSGSPALPRCGPTPCTTARTCCSTAASCWPCCWRVWLAAAGCAVRPGHRLLHPLERAADRPRKHGDPDGQRTAGDVGEDMAALVLAVPGVKGVHDLRTRVSGNQWFVQLHLELPGQLPLHEAHGLCVEASRVIRQRYPQADVMVHADPV